MAFAIASGVTPQAGLYTAVVAGFLISALGGSRTQIGGPTGAFVVIVAGIVAKFGVAGLAMVGILAGFLLLAMGITGLGSAVRYIPRPVTDRIHQRHRAADCFNPDQRLSPASRHRRFPVNSSLASRVLVHHAGTVRWEAVAVAIGLAGDHPWIAAGYKPNPRFNCRALAGNRGSGCCSTCRLKPSAANSAAFRKAFRTLRCPPSRARILSLCLPVRLYSRVAGRG